jgi:hypothetical protein
MSTISWKHNTDGLWSVASNWSGGVLPGAADTVVLDTLSYHTITFASGSSQIGSLSAVTDSLAVTGGSLGILGAASFDQILSINYGTLALLGASATVSGSFTAFYNGELVLGSATALTLDGTSNFGTSNTSYGLSVDGPGTVTTLGTTNIATAYSDAVLLGNGVTWNNEATVNDAGQIATGDGAGLGATITNAAGINFDFTTDSGGIYNGYDYNQSGQPVYGTSTFSNAGTVAKTGGTNTSHVDSFFTNTGVITAATGTVEFDGGGSFGGSLTGAGTIAFGGGTAMLSAGTNIAPGSLLFDGATATLATPFTYGGSVTLSNGSLTLTGATSFTGPFTQDGNNYDHLFLNGNSLTLTSAYLGSGLLEGAGTLTTGGTTTVSGWNNYTYYLGSNATWVNTGTVDQAYYVYVDYQSGGGFSLINQAGASYLITGDSSIGANNSNGIGSAITNAGTFGKTGGTNTSQVISNFSSTGTVLAATGTLEFDGSGSFAGSLTGTSTVSFASGSDTFASGLSIQTSAVLFDGATITLGGNESFATQQLSEVNGNVNLGGHTLTAVSAFLGGGSITGTGTVATSGTTAISGNNGGGILYLGGGVNIVNTGTIDQNYYLYVNYPTGSGFTLTNKAGATYNFTGNFNIGGNNYNSVGSSVVNQGTFAKIAGTGTTQVISAFTSTGTVSATVGVLEFDGGGSFGGTLTGTGTISIASNTMTLAAGIVIKPAEFLLDGGNIALAANASLTTTPLTITGAPSTINLDGFNLTLLNADIGCGYLFGPGGTLTTNGTTTVAGYNGYGFTMTGVTWDNNGTLNQNQTLYNDSSPGITEVNSATGTYNIQGDFGYGYNDSALGTFSNAGTFAKAAGTNTSSIYTDFNSTGVISAASGNLEFDGGGSFGGTLSGAGAISFGSNTATLAAGTTISVATLNLYNATLVLAGNVTDTNLFNETTNNYLDLAGNTLTLTGANLSNGTILGPGTLSLKGTTSLAAGNFYFGGSAVISNSGTVDQLGTVYLNADIVNDFTINNLAGATWDLKNTYYFASNNNGIECAFNNAGTFTLTGGTGYTLIYSAFDNTGTVSAVTGEIAFQDGGVFGGQITGTGLVSFQNNSYSLGSLTAATATNIEFYQSTITLTAGISLNGTLYTNGSSSHVLLDNQSFTLTTLDLANPGTGPIFDAGGTLTTTGTSSSIVDWYSNGVMIDFGGGSTWVNSGTVATGGIIQLGDSDLVAGTTGGTLINQAGGAIDFTSDDAAIRQGSYTNGYGTTVASSAVVINAGTLAKTGGTNTSHIYGTLTSTGTLATTTGALELDNGGSISGAIADGSTITLAGGSFTTGLLTVGGGAVVSDSVTLVANGVSTFGDTSTNGVTFTNTGLFELATGGGIAAGGSATSTFTNTGTLADIGTGRSAVAVSVVNSGTVLAEGGTLALTGPVSGTGLMEIGAGATLELGAVIAATQSVSFTAATGTLLLDAPAAPAEIVFGMTVGDVIDLKGVTATKASVNSADQLIVDNGSTQVAEIQLSGSYLSDTFTVGTDNNGGSLVTLTKASTAWKGTNGDWYSTNVWTNAVPNAQTNATVSATGSYQVTLNGGEIANVATLALSAPQATYVISGTLNVAQSFTMTAGSLALNGGVINGGVLAVSSGATFTFNNSALNNVACQGTLDLSENYAYVSLEGTTTFAAAVGHGAGVINLTGYDSTLYADGEFTLDNAALSIGNNGYYAALRSNDTNGQGGILTLGTALTITHTGTYATLSDSGSALDAVYNEGKIVAGFAGGTFSVTGNDFQNDAGIAVSNGDDFSIQSAQFVNTGSLTVSAAILGISGALTDAGSITATNSTLNFATSLSGTELTKIALGGDTLNLSGTLNEDGGTLSVGTGAKIVALKLSGTVENGTVKPSAGSVTFSNGATLNNVTYVGTMSVGGGVAVTLDGLLASATIADAGGGILFGSGVELDRDSYQGTMSLLSGNDVSVLGGLTLTGTGGTGTGAITAAAGLTESVLYFLDSETLSNVVITSGTGSGPGALGLFLAPVVPAGGTLTLASTTSFDVSASTTAGFFSTSPTTGASLGNSIVNDGQIVLATGAVFLGSDSSLGGFTNAGTITLGSGATWSPPAGQPLTTSTFTNTAAGHIAIGTNADFLTNGGGMSNAGSITVAAGAVATIQGNFSETGSVSVAAGGSFNIDGTTTLASLAAISGAGTLGIDGLLNLAGGTFDMAASGRISNVEIGGNIENGTFLNDAGTVTFGTLATLTAMTWKGNLNIGPGSTVDIANGLSLLTSSGGTPGILNLTGGGSIDYLGNTTLNNITLSSSSPSASVSSPGLADLLALGGTGTTLTLGANFTFDANAGAAEIIDLATSAGGTLINGGNINVTAGALWLDPSFASVVNNGTITLSDNTELDPTPGTTGSSSFTNTSTGVITLTSLDNFDLIGNAVNAGAISMGQGSEITVGGSFTNSGTISMSHGGSLTVGGTMLNSGEIIAKGASSDFVEATPGAGSCFSNGTLTGGTWDVSMASTLTLEFGSALTNDSADIILFGTGSVLRSLGTTIARVESTLSTITSAGSLSINGARGYTTSLALTDNGSLEMQGGTFSAAGLTVGSGAMFSGYGTVATAITNTGTVEAVGGDFNLTAAVTGAGTLEIAPSGELEIGAANAEKVLYSGTGGELRLDKPTSFTGTLSNFVSGNELLLASTNATMAVLSGATLTVTLSGGSTEKFNVAGNSSTVTLTTASDGQGDTLITFPGAAIRQHGTSASMSFVAPAASPKALSFAAALPAHPGDFGHAAATLSVGVTSKVTLTGHDDTATALSALGEHTSNDAHGLTMMMGRH